MPLFQLVLPACWTWEHSQELRGFFLTTVGLPAGVRPAAVPLGPSQRRNAVGVLAAGIAVFLPYTDARGREKLRLSSIYPYCRVSRCQVADFPGIGFCLEGRGATWKFFIVDDAWVFCWLWLTCSPAGETRSDLCSDLESHWNFSCCSVPVLFYGGLYRCYCMVTYGTTQLQLSPPLLPEQLLLYRDFCASNLSFFSHCIGTIYLVPNRKGFS